MAVEKISPSLKAEIALARFSPMKEGNPPLPYKALIDTFSSRSDGENIIASEKTIQKAIIDAFRNGYVTFEAAQSVPAYRLNESLAQQLREEFGLKAAIVVETGLTDPGLPYRDRSSDAIHSQLGHALAAEIAQEKLLIQSGDTIGVGSGRGVYHTIVELNKTPRLDLDEITIMSLTGSMFSHSSEARLEFMLDADINAAQLTQHFGGLIHSRPVCYPIAHSKTTRAQLIKKTWLDEREFPNHIPTLAVVGVGILGGGHRFYQEIEEGRRTPFLEPIYKDLNELKTFVDIVSRHHRGYIPVGDVCNRLFFVPPPATLRAKHRKAIEARVPGLIDRINECLITVTKTQLSRCRNVVLCAGTRIKSRAIYHLLRHSSVKVDMLSIDRETAEEVLLLKQEGRATPTYVSMPVETVPN